MLPVVICEPDERVRARWAELLGELVRREYPSLRIELLTGSLPELDRMVETETGIMLVILGVTDAGPEGAEGCIRRFAGVMGRNRDNYALLCVHDGNLLDAVLSRCMRPAGVLMLPLRDELARVSLRRILNDYEALYEQGNEGAYMVVSTGGTVQRIAYKDILYLEAQNKLLRVCTAHHAITIRASLNTLAEELPESFIRCHRSYIVNRDYVESFISPEMTVCLTTNERLPVSRSYKDALRERLKEVSRG